MNKLKMLTLSAEVDRCMRKENIDFCMDCSEYKECKLNKDLYKECEKLKTKREQMQQEVTKYIDELKIKIKEEQKDD